MMGISKAGPTPCVNAAIMSPASPTWCATPDDIRTTGKNLIASAGPGESSYTLYDRQVAAAAQIWLRETGTRWHAHPWVLFVSLSGR
jgi:hypothetical protein